MSNDIRLTEAERRVNAVRERNVRMIEAIQKREHERIRRSVMESHRIDVDGEDVKHLFDLSDPSFSIKAFREAAYRVAGRLREANAEGTLQQLLRSGIQTAINKEYQAVATNYQEWVNIVPSSKAIELYAPMYRAGFVQPMDDGDEPPQLGAGAADLQLRNRDFGAMFVATKNAFDDDQTGQLTEQAQQIGENAAIQKDSRCFVRFIGAAGTDAGGSAVPAAQLGSQAGETTWPFNTAFTNGGGSNRLTTYSVPTYEALRGVKVLAKQMKDPRGNKMAVNPDVILCGVGVSDAIHEVVDSDSTFYPSTSAMGALTNAGATGTGTTIGTTHAKNVLRGAWKVVESIWLPASAWGTMQAGKGFTLQQREPLSVVMENPSSGPSFSMRLHRWNIHERHEEDWREPRFAILGNDGSAT